MTEFPTLNLTGCLIWLKPLPRLIKTTPLEGSTVALVAAQLEVLRSTAQPTHKALSKGRLPIIQPQPQHFITLKIDAIKI